MNAGMFDGQLLTQLRHEQTAVETRISQLRKEIRSRVAELETLERRLHDIQTGENYLTEKTNERNDYRRP